MRNLLFLNLIIVFLFILVSSGTEPKFSSFNNNPPKKKKYISQLPKKENFWIFILAGQSNMAGYGIIEPQDTITSPRILALTRNYRWVVAEEPVHFYEGRRAGLDCSMSFAKELLKNIPDSITIGLVPCAVGGSSVKEWLLNGTHGGVKLYSNFNQFTQKAKKVGTIKGILWHQGERDANKQGTQLYKSNLISLFSKFRYTVGDDSLVIIAGELGSFLKLKKGYRSYPDSINSILYKVSEKVDNTYLIPTRDLTHKGDTLHFDSPSLRTLGFRYANKFLESQNITTYY